MLTMNNGERKKILKLKRIRKIGGNQMNTVVAVDDAVRYLR